MIHDSSYYLITYYVFISYIYIVITIQLLIRKD